MLKKFLILALILLTLISFSTFSEVSNDVLLNTIEQLTESNSELIQKVKDLESSKAALASLNASLTENLKKSNETIESLEKTIADDVLEIEGLRGSITSALSLVDEDRNISIGLGASYPLGITAIFNARPNNFPIGGFVDLNINKATGAFLSLGVLYSF